MSSSCKDVCKPREPKEGEAIVTKRVDAYGRTQIKSSRYRYDYVVPQRGKDRDQLKCRAQGNMRHTWYPHGRLVGSSSYIKSISGD